MEKFVFFMRKLSEQICRSLNVSTCDEQIEVHFNGSHVIPSSEFNRIQVSVDTLPSELKNYSQFSIYQIVSNIYLRFDWPMATNI